MGHAFAAGYRHPRARGGPGQVTEHWPWIPACAGMTNNLLMPSCISGVLLMGAFGGRKALDLVGERVEMDRAVGEGDFPVFVLPRAGVLQPIHVVTFRKILARLRPARFGSRRAASLSSPSFKMSPRRNTPKLDCIASCICGRTSPGLLPLLLCRIVSKRCIACSSEWPFASRTCDPGLTISAA